MATARTYCLNALVDIGIHATTTDVPSDDADRALRILNRILKEWNSQRLLKYQITNNSYTTANGTISVGPTGNIAATPRPVDVVAVRYTQGGSTIPLNRITKIDQLSLVSEGGTPAYYCYDEVSPNGQITLFPTPSGSYTYTVDFGLEFTTDYGLNDDVAIPGEYEALLEVGLCAELGKAWRFPVPDFEMKYADLMRIIKEKNLSFGKMELTANLRCNRGSNGLSDL